MLRCTVGVDGLDLRCPGDLPKHRDILRLTLLVRLGRLPIISFELC